MSGVLVLDKNVSAGQDHCLSAVGVFSRGHVQSSSASVFLSLFCCHSVICFTKVSAIEFLGPDVAEVCQRENARWQIWTLDLGALAVEATAELPLLDCINVCGRVEPRVQLTQPAAWAAWLMNSMCHWHPSYHPPLVLLQNPSRPAAF